MLNDEDQGLLKRYMHTKDFDALELLEGTLDEIQRGDFNPPEHRNPSRPAPVRPVRRYHLSGLTFSFDLEPISGEGLGDG